MTKRPFCKWISKYVTTIQKLATLCYNRTMPFQYIKNIHSQHIFRILVGGVIIISIGAAIFVAISSTSADDTILYFEPAQKTLAAGDTFWVDIMINAKNDYINAVAAYIAYSPDEVEILQIKTTESVIPLVVEQNIKDGQVEISGGKPTPGFSGKQKIASIQLRMKSKEGTATLRFSSDSAALTNNESKNILNLESSGQGVYSIQKRP